MANLIGLFFYASLRLAGILSPQYLHTRMATHHREKSGSVNYIVKITHIGIFGVALRLPKSARRGPFDY
jgi:hypothetical protein